MSDFGYDKLKYSDNLTVSYPDTNTKEGRAEYWDDKLGKLFKQVYIDLGTDGVEEVIKLRRFYINFNNLATKEMKRAYIKSDHFKENMDKYRETIAKLYH